MKKNYVILPIIAFLSCVVPFSVQEVYAGQGCKLEAAIVNGENGVDPSGSSNVKVEASEAQGTVITNKDETYNVSLNGTTPSTGPSSTTEQTTIPGGTTTITTEILLMQTDTLGSSER